MEPVIQTAEDHCRIQILVKSIGYRSTTTFNRLLERLNRVEAIQVSENPKRTIMARFVTSWNPDLTKFGEFQAFRRIFGFIGVAYSSQNTTNASDSSLRSSLANDPDSLLVESINIGQLGRPRRHSSILGSNSASSLELIKEQYDSIKEELKDMLVDSRCALFGFSKAEEIFESREILSHPSLEDSEEFENGVRDLIRNIYMILESRRLDLSYEKLETPPCPMLQDEEKYRVGLEKQSSKLYKWVFGNSNANSEERKKCVGRLRKQVADYTLLTGLPTLALDAYSASIDFLKATNDWLWLAAAYEGWGSAATILKYDEIEERLRKQSGLQRVSSMTPGQMRDYQEKPLSQHFLGVSIGHQRYRSDDDQLRLAAAAASAAQQLTESDAQQQKKVFRRPWQLLNLDSWSPMNKSPLDHNEIIERFKTALENYEKFSFAAMIEYECMVRASRVFKHQRLFVETEEFLRQHVGKFLDDSFTLFNNIMKAQICMTCAAIYKEIGFQRKNSFFSRLSVLFRLHTTDDETRTESDYRLVYPILYRTLSGYGINDTGRDAPLKGPVAVQVKALHEVFMSALRAKYYDAAVRHLCFILQVYYDHLERAASMKMIDELTRLVSGLPHTHNLAQHIALDNCGIILPPLQMTRFPLFSNFKIIPLPASLSPLIIHPNKKANIFIYSPFQNVEVSKDTYWVANCGCEVAVQVVNLLPIELTVKNLTLLTEGCAFEPVPVRLNLPACGDEPEPALIKLLGFPRSPGLLTVTGYSCEVLGLKNICAIKDTQPRQNKPKKSAQTSTTPPPERSQFTVEVLRALPLLQLETSLQRALTTEEHADPIAEATVFSGQQFFHSVMIQNTSEDLFIKKIRLEIFQPKVNGGPALVQLLDEAIQDPTPTNPLELSNLAPKELREIRFQIFGIDPSNTPSGSEKFEETRIRVPMLDSPGRASTPQINVDAYSQGQYDLIPYMGRILRADFVFRYVADLNGPNGEEYERMAKLPLAISIVPALTVSNWHVLPGDAPSSRYVVVDVTNQTDTEAELTYSQDRMISVQSKEVCRVPLLCPCCSDVPMSAFHLAAQRASHMMQMQEMERLRRALEKHVLKHLDIRWSIPKLRLEGHVPVGSLLSSVSLLKQLVVPAISVMLVVNGKPYLNEDDIMVGIGEMIRIQTIVLAAIDEDKPMRGELSLRCYQDLQNGKPFLDKSENVVICGNYRVPFRVSKAKSTPISDENKENCAEITNNRFETNFALFFRYEGIHKIRPVIKKINEDTKEATLFKEEEVFVPTVSFNVITKYS